MTATTPRPRAGTIIWAAVLLVVAATAFAFAVLDLGDFPEISAVWIVTGLGGILVVAALVALLARAGGRPAPVAESVETAEPVPVVEPSSVVEPVETPAPKPRAKKGQPVD